MTLTIEAVGGQFAVKAGDDILNVVPTFPAAQDYIRRITNGQPTTLL